MFTLLIYNILFPSFYLVYLPNFLNLIPWCDSMVKFGWFPFLNLLTHNFPIMMSSFINAFATWFPILYQIKKKMPWLWWRLQLVKTSADQNGVFFFKHRFKTTPFFFKQHLKTGDTMAEFCLWKLLLNFSWNRLLLTKLSKYKYAKNQQNKNRHLRTSSFQKRALFCHLKKKSLGYVVTLI